MRTAKEYVARAEDALMWLDERSSARAQVYATLAQATAIIEQIELSQTVTLGARRAGKETATFASIKK